MATIDNQDNHIGSLRDLEDFARLHIYIGGLQKAIANGDIQVGLEWRNTPTGSAPTINVYQAAESDGGDKYIQNSDGEETWAKSQFDGQFKTKLSTTVAAGDNSFRFPLWFWDTTDHGLTKFNADHPNRYLLFEGVTEGKGQLVLTFWKGSTPIGEGGGVWLDIKNIKKMYQRYDSATTHKWTADNFDSDPSEDKDNVIIFVHGWRMSPVAAENFSETMYKRLWHRGYKGRFAAFHWDTYWHDSAGWVPWAGAGIDAYLAYYNNSENIAWRAGASLKSFVNNLQFKNKNIVAHSMGNIVAGEALKEGMSIKNYALLNAAVPAACYDEDEGRIRQPSPKGVWAGLRFELWDTDTPDDDSDTATTRKLAYRGRFKTVTGNLINFFLPEDQATSFAWEINNDATKPPNGLLMLAGYTYLKIGCHK